MTHLKRFMAMNIFEVAKVWFALNSRQRQLEFLPKLQALRFALRLLDNAASIASIRSALSPLRTCAIRSTRSR